MVIKKDGRREEIDRQKRLTGLLKACEKRPVGMPNFKLGGHRRGRGQRFPDREISTADIGEFLMESLRELDKIAMRFASVYRDFRTSRRFSTS